MSEVVESLEDDLETQLEKIADQLSDLSASEEVPTGSGTVSEPFQADQVDFSSNNWLVRLAQVQVWLHLDTEIALDGKAKPIETLRQVFASLGADPGACLIDRDGLVGMTAVGADVLGTRLDTAVRLQREFGQALETLTRPLASEQWQELWEEVDSDEPAPEPIKAKTEMWPIFELADRAKNGRLKLDPSYQRGDVWPTADAQKLIESILRGIPLPSIILLKPASHGARAVHEVVDGKQRLTSILRFIGAHPAALKRVKEAHERFPEARLLEHFTNNYKKFRRLWKQHMGEALSGQLEAEYYFPFRLAQNSPSLKGDLAQFAGKYYFEIADQELLIAGERGTVSEVFERTSGYKLPIIEYFEAQPRQIHEVFRLYNRQGKHLNAEELRNAVYHDVRLVRLLLLASGDNKQLEVLAPYLGDTQDHERLRDIAGCLKDYGFGTARYKRTKLLSWLCALAMQPAIDANGQIIIRSTAKQIDTLLESIRQGATGGSPHPLSSERSLEALVGALHRCLEAHSASDCWDARFKDNEAGKKWQELQLVASLLGVFLVGVMEDAGKFLENNRSALLALTRESQRPEKTQNKTQWGFIARVALAIVELSRTDQQVLGRILTERYGSSCLPTLRAASVIS